MLARCQGVAEAVGTTTCRSENCASARCRSGKFSYETVTCLDPLVSATAHFPGSKVEPKEDVSALLRRSSRKMTSAHSAPCACHLSAADVGQKYYGL